MADKEEIKELAEFIKNKLKLSEKASDIFSESALILLDVSELLDGLDDCETAINSENIRRTLLSMFVGWIYYVDIGKNYERLVNLTSTFVEFIKERNLTGDNICQFIDDIQNSYNNEEKKDE